MEDINLLDIPEGWTKEEWERLFSTMPIDMSLYKQRYEKIGTFQGIEVWVDKWQSSPFVFRKVIDENHEAR